MPLASVCPLPLASHCDSVAVGRNTPVLPSCEVAPTSAVPMRTPAVSSEPLAAKVSLNHCGTVLAATVKLPGQ